MDNKKVFECKICNYSTIKPSDWIKHIDSMKHQRGGQKKSKKCEICNEEFFSHWNLKHHMLVTHETKEERQKQKYYCNDCDKVFFCSKYYDKHMNGVKHKNYVLAIKLEQELLNKNK